MFKRPLVFATILFVAGILASAYKLNSSILIVAAIILCVVSYLKTRTFRVCALALIIFLLGINIMSIAQSNRSKIQSQYAGKSSNMELVVQEFSENNKVIASFNDGGNARKIYLTAPSQSVLYPGDIVKGEIAISATTESKTGVSDFSSYLASRGVFLQGYAKSLRITGRKTDGFMGKIYSIRVFIDKVGKAYFSGNGRALFNAMVLGDKSLISSELSSALTASGLNHIAVVSGLHLSVMIALQMFFVHKIFGKRRIGYFFAVLGAVFIAFATGAGASVVRALIMCTLFLLSQILYRESDPLSSLSFAALSMLAANPFMIFNAGFVLSVLSVLGILLYSGKFTAIIGSLLPSFIASAVGVSISVQLTLIPALVHYFGIVTPYATISNLLIASLAGAYVSLGIIFILFSWAGPLAGIFGIFMKVMAQLILKVCYTISALPFSTIKITNADIFLLLIWVFMLVLIYVYPVDRRKLIKITAVFSSISVCMCFLPKDNSMNIHQLYYGEKAMTCVTLSSGESILVDCPDIYDTQLFENPLKPIEYAVLTSADYGELFKSKTNINTIIAPEELFDQKTKNALLNKADIYNIRVYFKKASEKVQAGNASISYLPVPEADSYGVCITETSGKTFISLQGLSHSDILMLCSKNTRFRCDYLSIPFTTLLEGADISSLCTGEIINFSK